MVYRKAQKFSDTLRLKGKEIFKAYHNILCCAIYHEISLCYSDVKKSLFPIKNGINILHMGSDKNIPKQYSLWEEIFKVNFTIFVLH